MNLFEEEHQEDLPDTGTGTEEAVENTKQDEPTPEPKKEEETSTLTQSQVNDIVTKRLAKQTESFYKHYGVSNEAELDELIKKARDYDNVSKKNSELSESNSKLNERVLFNTHSINKDREDDVRTYFKGKGTELSEDSLKEALKTHPEWCKTEDNIKPIPMGSSGIPSDTDTEEDKAMRLFGLKRFSK